MTDTQASQEHSKGNPPFNKGNPLNVRPLNPQGNPLETQYAPSKTSQASEGGVSSQAGGNQDEQIAGFTNDSLFRCQRVLEVILQNSYAHHFNQALGQRNLLTVQVCVQFLSFLWSIHLSKSQAKRGGHLGCTMYSMEVLFLWSGWFWDYFGWVQLDCWHFFHEWMEIRATSNLNLDVVCMQSWLNRGCSETGFRGPLDVYNVVKRLFAQFDKICPPEHTLKYVSFYFLLVSSSSHLKLSGLLPGFKQLLEVHISTYSKIFSKPYLDIRTSAFGQGSLLSTMSQLRRFGAAKSYK